MRFVKVILILALAFGAPIFTRVAAAAQEVAEHAEKAEPEVSPKAIEVFHIGSFPITNSMIFTWVVAIVLIAFAQIATRNIQEIPSGAQNFWEWLVEGLHSFLEGIIGPRLVKRTFWFFATIFIFILFANWSGLLPFVGPLGHYITQPDGTQKFRPILRGVNADLNMTGAMSLIFFACWFYWALQANGPIGFLKHLFAPKGESSGLLKLLLIVVFFMVGLLEVFSILFRPVSLSFRLYGNIYAGENLLDTMSHIVPSLSWLLPVPFYFMELLVGVIQALVFMLLTAVFTMLIMPHDDGHGEAHHH